MRIMVMGLPGSDASGLSQRLCERYGLPLFRIEDLCTDREGAARPLSQVRAVLQACLKNPGWVLEGCFPALELDAREKAADHIVVLLPKSRELRKALGFRVWLRRRREYGKLAKYLRAKVEKDESGKWVLLQGSEDFCPVEDA